MFTHVWPFELQNKPNREFLDRWQAKTREVIDNYRPDLMWWDFALERVEEHYKLAYLAHYYNSAANWGNEVVVTYKWHHLVPGSAVIDLELGRFKDLTYHDWITDTSADDQGAWSYVQDAGFKPVSALIHNLVDNVSKNGYLLLNVGPRADGTIPDEVKAQLRDMGTWLAVNGEAIYGTTPWMVYGEGPTQMTSEGAFSEEHEVVYTGQDVRFTTKDGVLYAICLGWPRDHVTLNSVGPLVYESEIRSVTMLGHEGPLRWRYSPVGLTIDVPEDRPCEHAYTFRIERGEPFWSIQSRAGHHARQRRTASPRARARDARGQGSHVQGRAAMSGPTTIYITTFRKREYLMLDHHPSRTPSTPASDGVDPATVPYRRADHGSPDSGNRIGDFRLRSVFGR